jgi:RNA polymerase sigma-70 factor (ECF subfamily)
MSDFKTGDLMAFNLLYARHKGPTYRYLLRQCHDKNLTDDLMQELWEKLINSKNRYQPDAKFTTWLYRIAHNVVVDHQRHFSVISRHVDNEHNIEQSVDSLSNTPEKIIENNKKQKNINDCLGKLPSTQLETFLLKQETDLTLQHIADIVESSLEATKSRLRYAYDALRKCLSNSLMIVGK